MSLVAFSINIAYQNAFKMFVSHWLEHISISTPTIQCTSVKHISNGILIEEIHSTVTVLTCASLHSFDSIVDVIVKVSTRFLFVSPLKNKKQNTNIYKPSEAEVIPNNCIALNIVIYRSKLSSFAFISREIINRGNATDHNNLLTTVSISHFPHSLQSLTYLYIFFNFFFLPIFSRLFFQKFRIPPSIDRWISNRKCLKTHHKYKNRV